MVGVLMAEGWREFRETVNGKEWVWCGDEPPDTYSWRRLVLLITTAIILISFVPLLITFLAWRDNAQDQLNQQKERIAEEQRLRQEAVQRERQLRVQFNRDLNSFVFQQCLNAERRDAVIVKVLATIPNPPPVVVEAIDALEPTNEPDCTPPPATSSP